MFKTEESSFLPDSDPGQIDYGIEYNVYDVTPDVSIDFVSFTTEESEGESGGVEYLSTINQFALLMQAFQAPLIISRCLFFLFFLFFLFLINKIKNKYLAVVRSLSALPRHRRFT